MQTESEQMMEELSLEELSLDGLDEGLLVPSHKTERSLRRHFSRTAELRHQESLQWQAREIVKAKRDTKKKNERHRKVLQGIKSRFRWSSKKGWHDPRKDAENTPNQYTTYHLGRRSNYDLEMPKENGHFPHPSRTEISFDQLGNREFTLLNRLIDSATDYVLDPQRHTEMTAVPKKEMRGDGEFRWVSKATEKRNRRHQCALEDGDLHQRIEALNYFSPNGSIPRLSVINELVHVDQDDLEMQDADFEERYAIQGTSRRSYGPRKEKLKRKRSGRSKAMIATSEGIEKRVLEDAEDLLGALRNIVDRRAKADHFVVAANGTSDLVSYLLRETQSRVDRHFSVNPRRMLVLDYAQVRRKAADLVTDINQFLSGAHAALHGDQSSHADDSRKPAYLRVPATRYTN